VGGPTWEGAGRIWWAALTGGAVRPTTDFSAFAAVTVAESGDHRTAIEEAWAAVGVVPGASSAPRPRPGVDAPAELVVRRSGGFAGMTLEGRCDLAGEDATAREARDLLDRSDLQGGTGATSGDPMPDRFVYTFELPGRALVRVPEQHLTPDLRRLADLVLDG